MLEHPGILDYLLLRVSENVSSADNQQERLELVVILERQQIERFK